MIRHKEPFALQSCRDKETGIVGKCCRDPNYVDPWPTGGLPANYTGGFDEQGFPTFLNITKVRPPSKKPVTQPPTKIIPKPPVPPIHEQQEPTHIVPEHSVTPQFVVPIPTQLPPINTPAPFIKRPYETASSDQHAVPIVPELPRPSCGVRNYVSMRMEFFFPSSSSFLLAGHTLPRRVIFRF